MVGANERADLSGRHTPSGVFRASDIRYPASVLPIGQDETAGQASAILECERGAFALAHAGGIRINGDELGIR